MTDPYLPPPRQPMPERLRTRLTEELAATTRGRWRGPVVVPLVAAAVVAALVVVGVTTVRDRQSVFPAETATAVPATASPTPAASPSASATAQPTPKPVLTTLGVRPMTTAEISGDAKTCRRQEGSDDLVRLGRAPRTRYAMVQRRAGWTGAGSVEVRVLIIEDGASYWSCENGIRYHAARGPIAKRTTSFTTPPVVEVENYGGFSSACDPGPAAVVSSELFLVDREVAVGRTRLVGKKHRGPWQTTRPVDGLVAFPFTLDGDATQQRSVKAEFEFLDRHGSRLTIQPYGERGTPTTTRYRSEFATCADLADLRRPPKPVTRPSSDAAGLRTCQAMVAESADRADVDAGGEWKSRLLIATSEEWGTVFSDGQNLVGCSLYPTKEISPPSPDTPAVRKSAFYFAVNPIGDTGTASLWAAGRAPTDVSAITYRLPGDRDVRATIDVDGYWMLKYHTRDGQHIGPEQQNVSDWPPVVVTVTRPSGTQRYTIGFNEKTMCRQVSHGC